MPEVKNYLMDNDRFIEFARTKFTNNTSGKYDCIDQMLSKEMLLTAKPKYIREYLSNVLSIDLRLIHLKSFYTWLSRYRIRNKNNVLVNDRMVKNDIKDWRTFVPSMPIKQEEKPLINFPYKK